MIFTKKPQDFNSRFDIVSCFCEKNGKLLILLRQDHKPQGNTWGIPAGKIDQDEDLVEAVGRELREETGLSIPLDKFEFVVKVYNRYPDYDFIFHIFKTKIDDNAEVTINHNEHKEFIWLLPEDVLSLSNAMEDLDNCIKLCYLGFKNF